MDVYKKKNRQNTDQFMMRVFRNPNKKDILIIKDDEDTTTDWWAAFADSPTHNNEEEQASFVAPDGERPDADDYSDESEYSDEEEENDDHSSADEVNHLEDDVFFSESSESSTAVISVSSTSASNAIPPSPTPSSFLSAVPEHMRDFKFMGTWSVTQIKVCFLPYYNH